MSEDKNAGYLIVAIGGVVAWGAIRGYSLMKAFGNAVQGKNPNEGQSNAFPLGGNSGSGGNTGGGGVPSPTSSSEKAIISAVLQYLSCPTSSKNISSMSSWQRKECPWNNSPPDGAIYTHNPWNTTMPMPGHELGNVNSVGVKRYDSWQTGIKATGDTIRNGNYPTILAHLKSGDGLCGLTSHEFLTWSGNYSSVC